MPNRRDKGEGTLRKRSNGSWEGRISYTDPDTGRAKIKSVYAATKNEARHKLQAFQDAQENPQVDASHVASSQLTYGNWLDLWMRDYKKNSVRASTYISYHQNIENHIRPFLGEIALQKIKPDHIQKMLNTLLNGSKNQAALSSASVIKVKNIVSGSLEQALRNQLIAYNPARATAPPKREKSDIRVLTEEEQIRFMKAIKGHRLEALYTLALATGMRRGEILALSWDCVNFDTGNISVKGAIARIKDPDSSVSKLRYSEPKTKTGRRFIPILPGLVPVLLAHRQRQDAEKAAAGSAWNSLDLVFCSNVGTILEPTRLQTTLKKITKAAGLPGISFHSLRHTFATRMLEAGVSPKVVQEVLGHADVTLTLNTYSHVLGSTAHEQMMKINGLFNEGELKPRLQEQMSEAEHLRKAAETIGIIQNVSDNTSRFER